MKNARSRGTDPKRTLLVGWTTAFLVGADLFIVAPLLPSLASEFDSDPASLTILVSAFSLTYALACPLQARVAERLGLVNVLCFGVLALGMADLYAATASNLFNLALSRCFAGIAAASVMPMLYALTAQRAAPAHRAASLALVNSGLVLAMAAGAPTGLMIGALSGWRTVFWLLGCSMLILVPVHLAIWGLACAQTAYAARDGRAERVRDAGIFFIAMSGWSTAIYGTYTLLGTAMHVEMGWPVPVAAAVLACFGAGATLGALAGGRLADRVGPAKFVQFSFAMTGAAFAGTSWIYDQNSAWLLGASLFLTALAAYGLFPALQACAAAVFVARRPTILGLMSSALYVGTAVGALSGAELFSEGGMSLVLLASAVMSFAGCIIASRLPVPIPVASPSEQAR